MPFYPVRTTTGREIDVALIIERRAKSSRLDVRSVVVPPRLKGFVLVEAPAPYVVLEVIRGIRDVRGGPGRRMEVDEVVKLIRPTPVIELIDVGDIVELVAGPFKGMKARVEFKDPSKNEVVLNILEAAYPLQITVPVDYVKPVKR
ncbi:transcription antitermination protein NusG [Ignicoccus islandicus DSM 13165]|uniref:Transcription elongation factor Spt5 n=1 Tax=Ignicoccus islandicus DSM 13165 TaxID=940295 RepID=A0A0U3F275_9CREN|nr:transcription elongation factor Spt5 [Ignicoccus islandicus]ALU11653.1 transcription antitermination protein NusG [Ignicoccus islandicus DSM 13165]